MNRFGVRHGLIGCAAIILVAASLAPGDAFARGGRGGGGGGARAGGGAGMRMAGGARPSHPIAGRPGNPGRPIAGRPGGPVAGAPGYGWRGAGYGFAAGAAATGLYSYYNNYNSNGCYTDPNGNWVCPNQYQYPYSGY